MKNKRILRPILWASTAAVAFLLLQGCSTGPQKYSGGSSWNNYKCTAVNGAGRKSLGWSTSKSAAKSSALDKCRAHGSHCRVAHCSSKPA